MAGLCFYKRCASRVKSFRDEWYLKTGQENFNLWRAPKSVDKKKWLQNLPPDSQNFDFENPKHTLCSLHFEERHVIRENTYMIDGRTYSFPLDRPKLTRKAVPTIFEGTDIISMTMKRDNSNSDAFSNCQSNVTRTHPYRSQNSDDEVNFQIMNVGSDSGNGSEVQQVVEVIRKVKVGMEKQKVKISRRPKVLGPGGNPQEIFKVDESMVETQLMQDFIQEVFGNAEIPRNGTDRLIWELGIDDFLDEQMQNMGPTEKMTFYSDDGIGMAEDQINEENFISSEIGIKSENVNGDETVMKNEYINSEADGDDTNDKTNFSWISGTEERIRVVIEVMGNDNEIKSDQSKWPKPAGSFSRSSSEDSEEIEPEIESEMFDIPEDEIEVIDLSGDEDDGQNTHKNSKTSSEPKLEASEKSTYTAESSSQPVSESDIISAWSDLILFPSQNISDASEVVENIPEVFPEYVRMEEDKKSVEVEGDATVELSTSEIVPEISSGTSDSSRLEERSPSITKVKLTLTSNEKDINILKRCHTTPTVYLSNSGYLAKRKRLQNVESEGTGLITANLVSSLVLPNEHWCVNAYPIPYDRSGRQLFTVNETMINSGLVEITRKSITVHPNWNMTFTVFSTPLRNFKIAVDASTTQDIQAVLNRFAELNVCEGIPRLGNYKYLPLFEIRLRSTVDYCYRSPACPLLLVVSTGSRRNRKRSSRKVRSEKRCFNCKEMKECLEFTGSRTHLMAKYEHLFV